MKSENLIKVFEDTVSLVENGSIKTNSTTTKHNFEDIINPINKVGKIEVWPHDSVTLLESLKTRGFNNFCLLNMASRKKAGGGVRSGSRAQEECLFRCSNLFETVSQSNYPLNDEDVLYTKDAVFFKNFYYDNISPIITDVVTVAAINLNENSYFDFTKGEWISDLNDKPENYEYLTKQKIRMMISLAVENKVENLILGAWGCGVFKNDPTEMAIMFKEVIDEGYGINIHFAIINDHNSVDDNYEMFKNVLNV